MDSNVKTRRSGGARRSGAAGIDRAAAAVAWRVSEKSDRVALKRTADAA